MAEEFRLPAAFEARMRDMLGEEWEAFLEGYTRENARALRFNRRKKGMPADSREGDSGSEAGVGSEAGAGNDPAAAVTQEKLLGRLGISAAERVPWASDAWYYEEEARPGRHPYHEMGLCYIQEPSAMSAAALLLPEPGERILDLCAAPGGKSTQLASLLGRSGLLIANEIVPNRSKILSQNIERMGIDNCIVTNEDGRDLRKHFPEYFHRILVDAPCSGEGMFRKNEEAMGEWSPENVAMCADRQQEILGYAAEMLMPGGTLVYSTCTFAPAENEDGIRRFLESHPDFTVAHRDCPRFSPGVPAWAEGDPRVAGTFRLWPHRLRGEGHYVAVLQRSERFVPGTKRFVPGTNRSDTNRSKRKDRRGGGAPAPDRTQLALLKEFLTEALTGETADWILAGSLLLFGDNLYRLPPEAPDLTGLRVERAGLHIGTFRKNRFEPSHALALWAGREEAKQVLDLSPEDPRTAAYLHGETLQGDCTDPAGAPASGRGWCLVCVDGFSAGWGKADRGMVKNHYPKGLRR